MINLRAFAVLLALSSLAACDPAFVRSLQIDPLAEAAPLVGVVSSIDAIAEEHGFVRTRITRESREDADRRGHTIVAEYQADREKLPALAPELMLLRILKEQSSDVFQLEVLAFVSLSEPAELREFRLAVVEQFCNRGYLVEQGCGA